MGKNQGIQKKTRKGRTGLPFPKRTRKGRIGSSAFVPGFGPKARNQSVVGQWDHVRLGSGTSNVSMERWLKEIVLLCTPPRRKPLRSSGSPCRQRTASRERERARERERGDIYIYIHGEREIEIKILAVQSKSRKLYQDFAKGVARTVSLPLSSFRLSSFFSVFPFSLFVF